MYYTCTTSSDNVRAKNFPYVPLTLYSNGEGATKLEKTFQTMHQGNEVFLGNKPVEHSKSHVIKYANPLNGNSVITNSAGTCIDCRSIGNHYVYERAAIDMRNLEYCVCEVFDPEKGSYSHGVAVPYKGGIATYHQWTGPSTGDKLRPTWTVYWGDTQGNAAKFRKCTPDNQGYNEPSGSTTEPSQYPRFTNDQLRQINEARVKFEAAKYTIPMKEERVYPLDDYIPCYMPAFIPSGSSANLGDMCTDAISRIRFFTGNGGALIKDLLELNTAVESSLKDISKVAKGRAKALASIYLSVHYGYKLLASDIKELTKEIGRYLNMFRYTSVTSSKSTQEDGNVHCVTTLQIFYEVFGKLHNDLTKLSRLLDLAPSTHVVWDSIPFSFVVDWVANIGELCSMIDNFYTLTQEHRVVGSGISFKKKRQFDVSDKRSTCHVEQSTYVRSYYKNWYPIPHETLSVGPPSIGHAGELTALVISNH